jgi:hypothetical protein
MADNTTTTRKKKANKTSGKAQAKRTAKREAAEKRKEEHLKLSVAEKIARLDKIFGVGLGAKKERARLAKKIK